MKFFASLFISTLAAFSALDAFAQNTKQRKLINQDSRPTVEEMLSDEKYLETFRAVFAGHKERIQNFGEHMPALIVSLEKAFPNGIYAFLGRDMDLVADATDAFYRSINQNDRVARVRFSTPSLVGADFEKIGKYLSQIGLDVGKYDHEARPFVIIDYTSYGLKGLTNVRLPSQARFVVQGAIRYLKNKGISPKEIPNRIAVATLSSSAKKNIAIEDPLKENSIAKTPSEYIARHYDLNSIVYLDAGDINLPYHSEWHGKYDKMRKNGNGEIEIKPIGYFSFDDKVKVYKGMVDVVNLMTSKKMKKGIFDLAAQHSVTFEGKSEISEQELSTKKTASIEANFKKDIKSLVKGLKKLAKKHEDAYTEKFKGDGMKMKLTPNGSEVIAALEKEEYRVLEHYLEISLEVLIQLYNADKIGARDFRRIFSYILTLKEIETKDIFQVVLANYRDVLPLEIMFGRMDEREKYAELGGYGGANYKLILEKSKIGLSCSFLF